MILSLSRYVALLQGFFFFVNVFTSTTLREVKGSNHVLYLADQRNVRAVYHNLRSAVAADFSSPLPLTE